MGSALLCFPPPPPFFNHSCAPSVNCQNIITSYTLPEWNWSAVPPPPPLIFCMCQISVRRTSCDIMFATCLTTGKYIVGLHCTSHLRAARSLKWAQPKQGGWRPHLVHCKLLPFLTPLWEGNQAQVSPVPTTSQNNADCRSGLQSGFHAGVGTTRGPHWSK